jgi:hypothetical protein
VRASEGGREVPLHVPAVYSLLYLLLYLPLHLLLYLLHCFTYCFTTALLAALLAAVLTEKSCARSPSQQHTAPSLSHLGAPASDTLSVLPPHPSLSLAASLSLPSSLRSGWVIVTLRKGIKGISNTGSVFERTSVYSDCKANNQHVSS